MIVRCQCLSVVFVNQTPFSVPQQTGFLDFPRCLTWYLPSFGVPHRIDRNRFNPIFSDCWSRFRSQHWRGRLFNKHFSHEAKEIFDILHVTHRTQTYADYASWLPAQHVKVIPTSHALSINPSQFPWFQGQASGESSWIADAAGSKLDSANVGKLFEVGFADP